VTPFDDFWHTLKKLFCISADPNFASHASDLIHWQLERFESQEFAADLTERFGEFILRISNCVWPCLEAFAVCGIDWPSREPMPLDHPLQYSETEWTALLRLTDDGTRDWSSITPAIAGVRSRGPAARSVLFPLSVLAPARADLPIICAAYGVFWLILHEATHARMRHLELHKAEVRRGLISEFPELHGLELGRACESEADWQATVFLRAHVSEMILWGYERELSFAAGFGKAAALLLLNPSRQALRQDKEIHDPGYMRADIGQDTLRAAYWLLAEAYFPEYARQAREDGARAILEREKRGIAPSKRFEESLRQTDMLFLLGEFSALRLAQAIGEANIRYEIAARGHFEFGDRYDWKNLQEKYEDEDFISRRRETREVLRRGLPYDTRFGNGVALDNRIAMAVSRLAHLRLKESGPDIIPPVPISWESGSA
jgi:hypothetical protein